MKRKSAWRGTALLLAAVLGSACGGDPPGLVEPNPAVQPFVGDWAAVAFVVTNAADTTVTADLLLNGSFTITVEPSGQYTATLVLGALAPFVEFGQLSVSTNFLTFTPSEPTDCLQSSQFTFSGPDYVTLDGATCFDFNLDGEFEDAIGHIELERQ